MGVVVSGLVVVLVLAGILMNRVLNIPQTSAPEDQVQQVPTVQPLHPRLEPLLSIAQTFGPTADPAAAPARPLPDDVLLLPAIDMNGDGVPEAIVAQLVTSELQLERNLREAGFNVVVSSLIVVQDEIPFLRIDEYAIRDQLNRRIINQVPASNGYAMRIYEFEDEFNETPFERPVTVFDLVIIDEFGRSISDEITIYWKPSTGKVAATNTFGAPGTF